MKNAELIIPEHPTPVVIDDSEISLLYWLIEYGKAEITGSPTETVRAKTSDLKKFYEWLIHCN